MVIDFLSSEYHEVTLQIREGKINKGCCTFMHGALEDFMNVFNATIGKDFVRWSKGNELYKLAHKEDDLFFDMLSIMKPLNEILKDGERAKGVDEKDLKGLLSLSEDVRSMHVDAVQYYICQDELNNMKKFASNFELQDDVPTDPDEVSSYSNAVLGFRMINDIVNAPFGASMELIVKNYTKELKSLRV